MIEEKSVKFNILTTIGGEEDIRIFRWRVEKRLRLVVIVVLTLFLQAIGFGQEMPEVIPDGRSGFGGRNGGPART
ncbi:MAG TPA: hypothetical protein VGO67_14040 [Verrucomicrobiae bacterium]